MRTTIDIDDELMTELMRRHAGQSKTQAIENAIDDHLRRGALDWFLDSAGEIEIADVSGELRSVDRQI